MKHLSKWVFISMLITGCSSNPDSVQALKAWDDKYEECFITNQTKRHFPDNPWFNSLSLEDKKIVIGYLYNYNSRSCISREVETLRGALQREGNDSLLHIFEADLSPLESVSLDAIKHLDQQELRKLQSEYSQPFNLSEIIESLNLYN